MNQREEILDILSELTGSDDVKTDLDMNLFDTGLLDSMGTVQLILELQTRLGLDIQVSEFDRAEWETPNKILEKVESMQ